jgi:transposase InsO family protein
MWLRDGSCVRLRPLHRNHVWSYDFVSVRTHDGELRVLAERWRKHYNTVRPHSSLSYRPPAPRSLAAIASIDLNSEIVDRPWYF